MRRLDALIAASVLAFGLTLMLDVPRASACGGLFCNRTAPVNQAAERIVFVDNGDGTVTAVIEIQYDGPSERFSWVLPVPGTPKIGVSSTTVLDWVQGSTNPQYNLSTSFVGCALGGAGGSGGSSASAGAGGKGGAPSVIVLAQGTVGPFDYEIIGLDQSLPNPADIAIKWLGDNGYEVSALAPDLLGPYLAEGLNLLAFRLSKSNDAGSIRPVMLTYASERPYIPIRPTAVAANDDMGIMVWVVSAARAVPDNYKALELNEALIDWFNPTNNYNAVVSAAADEAAGQGFVTEFAGPSNLFDSIVQVDRANWTRTTSFEYPDAISFLEEVSSGYGSWDGFEDALKMALTLPADVLFSDFIACARCYITAPGVTFDKAAFLRALYEQVYKPVAETETLLLSRPYVTRLYTTMSADEMTMDPAFNYNADLPDVDNVHTARQEASCDGSGFRVILGDGTEVFGKQSGVWPLQLGDVPAARKIMQLSTQGKGVVVMDNSKMIADVLEQMRPPKVTTDAGSGGGGRGGVGGAGRGGSGGFNGNVAGNSVGPGMSSGEAVDAGSVDGGGGEMSTPHDSDDCAAAGPLFASKRAGGFALIALALGSIARRRRRG